jgi:uncharacterized paraquat-inducible protein A
VLAKPVQETASCYSDAMPSSEDRRKKLAPVWRALVEIGFIVFLFYSNLLMGDFTHGNAKGKDLISAVFDIFTYTNFVIAIVCALIGYVVFEYLRKQL